MERRVWAAAVIGTLKIQLLVIGQLCGILRVSAGSRYALACSVSGAAVILPHFVTGLALWTRSALTGQLSAAALLGGEGLKLLLTLTALYGAHRWLGSEIAWGGFIAGIIGALKAQWLALWFTRDA